VQCRGALRCVDVQFPRARRRLRVQTQLRSSHATHSTLPAARARCRRTRRLQQGQRTRAAAGTAEYTLYSEHVTNVRAKKIKVIVAQKNTKENKTVNQKTI